MQDLYLRLSETQKLCIVNNLIADICYPKFDKGELLEITDSLFALTPESPGAKLLEILLGVPNLREYLESEIEYAAENQRATFELIDTASLTDTKCDL